MNLVGFLLFKHARVCMCVCKREKDQVFAFICKDFLEAHPSLLEELRDQEAGGGRGSVKERKGREGLYSALLSSLKWGCRMLFSS